MSLVYEEEEEKREKQSTEDAELLWDFMNCPMWLQVRRQPAQAVRVDNKHLLVPIVIHDDGSVESLSPQVKIDVRQYALHIARSRNISGVAYGLARIRYSVLNSDGTTNTIYAVVERIYAKEEVEAYRRKCDGLRGVRE